MADFDRAIAETGVGVFSFKLFQRVVDVKKVQSEVSADEF